MIDKYLTTIGVGWSKTNKCPIYKSNRRGVDVFKEWGKFCQFYPDQKIPVETFGEAVLEFAKKEGRVRDNEDWEPVFPTCNDTEELIQQAMEMHRVKFTPKGDEILNIDTGDNIKLDDFRNMILFHRDKYVRDSKAPDGTLIRDLFNVEEVSRAIDHAFTEQTAQYLAQLRTVLKYRPGFENYSFGVVRGILERAKVPPEKLELSIIMVLQWIWQVKSFLYNREVPDPIFLNIQSTYQGGGKTEFVNRITLPLKDFTDPDAKLLHALDEREKNRFTSNYVVIFDELVVGNSVGEYGQAIAAFKQILTAKIVNPRTMYTTKQAKMKRIYSGIGTSNPPMIETIYDETGMRRFFEIEFQITEGSIFADLQKIDPVALWQGVNENLIGGFIPVGSANFKALREVQRGYKRMDLVDAALEYGELEHDPILARDEMVQQIETAIATQSKPNIDQLEKELNIQLIPAFKFRASVVEWVKENVESAAAKYVKGVHSFASSMQEKGFYIVRLKRENFIVCHPIGGTAATAAHLPPPAYQQKKDPI